MVEQKVSEAKQILKKYNLKVDVDPEDLISYFQATSPTGDTTTLNDVLKNLFLLVHELVEINELKKRGLSITKDVIVKNIDTVYNAHLIATEVELYIAYKHDALKHIRNRIKNIESWLEDPLLPKGLYNKCYELLKKSKKWGKVNG